MNMETIQAEFEAWANGRDLTRTRAGEYLSCWVQNDWETWQAARQPVGHECVHCGGDILTGCSACGESDFYTAPPAKTVDLGQLSTLLGNARTYLSQGLNSQSMNLLGDALALIDSQKEQQ